jgi:hypothetical protein
MTQIFKEAFTGKYDGVTSPLVLQRGAISDGKNIRKVSSVGGWKVRGGCALHNTTALESEKHIDSLHFYTHPRNADSHFIAQVNSKLYDSTTTPPTAGTTFGSTIRTTNIGTTPGFSDIVGERWFYADGASRPITWGGDNPFPIGFITVDTDGVKVDYTRKVIDERTDTYAILLSSVTSYFLVCSPEIAHKISLEFGSVVNAETSVLSVASWVGGTWEDRATGFSDGTTDEGATLAKNGVVSWTRNTTDTMSVHNGIMGYWYKVAWNGALTTGVQIKRCRVGFDPSQMSNKWDGIPNLITGARFYNGDYVEMLGKLGTETTALFLQLSAADSSQMIYVKTPHQATGFGMAIASDYENTESVTVDRIEYWDGDSWEEITGLEDNTLDITAAKSFAKTGWINWNGASYTSYMRTIPGDDIPGYWYRVRWNGTLNNADTDVRLYFMTYAPFPEVLPIYDGCIEFKDRLMLWGDPEYPNRLRYSSVLRPDCFVGPDSGYTDQFGDMQKLLCCVRFFNELVVFKKNSVWFLEGFDRFTFGRLRISEDVGLSSPKSVIVAEGGSPEMHSNEALSIVVWQDIDGVYALDGKKPVKISKPVDHYFNPEYDTCIDEAYIDVLQAYQDKVNNEYHLMIPDGSEIVYNFVRNEWFPIWEREIPLICGLTLRGADGRFHSYGGSAGGLVIRLEYGTNDVDTSNEEAAIEHSIVTRAICASQEVSTTFEFTLRRLWAEINAQSLGSIKTVVYKNEQASGVEWNTPQEMSLVSPGADYAFPRLDGSFDGCLSVKFAFSANILDYAIKLHTIMYELESRGLKYG